MQREAGEKVEEVKGAAKSWSQNKGSANFGSESAAETAKEWAKAAGEKAEEVVKKASDKLKK